MWDPDVHKAMLLVADAGNVNVFSNALYGYTPQYPNVATSISAWVKYSSCGTTLATPPGVGANKSTFLATTISNTDTTVTTRSDLFSITSWPPTGFLWLGDEEMSYGSHNSSTFTISARGVRGTTAVSHAACVGSPGSAGCNPTTGATGSRIMEGCPAPVKGDGSAITDHPTERHPDNVSAYGHGFLWQSGGYQEVGTPSDTWKWNLANNWLFVPGSNGLSTHDAAIEYFADKDVLIRYGGQSAINGTQTAVYCFAVSAPIGCTAINQWLILNGTNLDTSAGHVAPPRMKHRMIYDSANKQILMVGGTTSNTPNPADAQVWGLSFNSRLNKWQWMRKADMPYAEWFCPVAFDENLSKAVLLTAAVNNINGGSGTSPTETWLYDPVLDSWKKTAVTGPLFNVFADQTGLVFNPDNKTLVMSKQDGPTTIKMYELADLALGGITPQPATLLHDVTIR